ncbi:MULTISPECIES: dicarboxylate/amino acid:cation symporter [Virgibacillus]|uniref:Glutamate-aspartate carrier protein n=2 Tax=Virgibacillus TaxID=84406 RepID=A0A024Q6F4_9BACI|nr:MULTISPECIES: dicarboxylate/amino acid:cation symporter [Virgibacillus]EQB38676.1 sodium:dicarboxylate symporter [Virgibacillus sp. CM-4]MYL41390.1 cation:dicarboxylase symporter family transporter [Virgibacillus massiliensis]GGJ56796.1 sodium:dicarboxylate symporter [Virgibacillus kapii]CDQ37815.1 Glutamate-aspartate carrier protein [Virgibacillus massiliensis]
MNLTKKILIALVLGVIAGIGLTFSSNDFFSAIDTYVLNPVGEIFLNLIMMIVVPIVFVSIVLGTAGLGDPSKLGKIGIKTIGFYLVTTAVALVIGLGVGLILEPGQAGTFDTENASYEEEAAPPIMDTFINIIPENPIEAMSTGNMLQIIAFAVFIGVALAILGEKTSGIHKLFEQANEILIFLVNAIMKTAPYGAFALIASAIGEAGLDALGSMAMYMVAVILALLIHGAVTYSLAIKGLGKASPIKFYKLFFPAMSVAFSTSSSSATLPVSMKMAQERLGVKKSISSFVQPLGATINMDGTAIMQAVATVFIAQVYAEPLGISQMLMVVLTATLASIGTAGVPGVGLIMLAMVLKQVGLPVDGIALIIGVDRLLDMLRTSLNITGDAACAYIISESDKRNEKDQAEQTA